LKPIKKIKILKKENEKKDIYKSISSAKAIANINIFNGILDIWTIN
jgi:hypothetical protein